MKGIKDEYGTLSVSHLQEQHTEWIKEELDKVDIRPWIFDFGIAGNAPIKTFVQWRSLVSDSVSGFGKLLKIQPITIRKYESGATHNLPIQLVERLQHWGFSDEYISAVAELPIG